MARSSVDDESRASTQQVASSTLMRRLAEAEERAASEANARAAMEAKLQSEKQAKEAAEAKLAERTKAEAEAKGEVERNQSLAKLELTRLQKELRAQKMHDDAADETETEEQAAQRSADAACTYALEELAAKRKELAAERDGSSPLSDPQLQSLERDAVAKREALQKLHAALRAHRPTVGDVVRIVEGLHAGKEGAIKTDDHDFEPYTVDNIRGYFKEADVIALQFNSSPVHLSLAVKHGRVAAQVGARRRAESSCLVKEAKLRELELPQLKKKIPPLKRAAREQQLKDAESEFAALRDELKTHVTDGRARHALRVKGALLELDIRREELKARQRKEPVRKALEEHLGERRIELREKQEELRDALGEIKANDTVMMLESEKEAIVESASRSVLRLRGHADSIALEDVLLLNAEQKALRNKEQQLRRALKPDEERVAAEHEAKLRAPVDEAEEQLRKLADEVLRGAREQGPLLEHMASDLGALPNILQAIELGDAECSRGVAQLRACMRASQHAISATTQALDRLVKQGPQTSRAGYLRTLEEHIGPKPMHSWEEEWVPLVVEWLRLSGFESYANEEYVRKNQMPEQNRIALKSTGLIDGLLALGWPPERADFVGLQINLMCALGRAVRENDPCYAATTYALTEALFAQRSSGDTVPPRLYVHRVGLLSATESEPAWERLEEPDRTGFCGLTSAAPTKLQCNPKCFTALGCSSQLIRSGGSVEYKPCDSDVIAVDSAADDDHGAHAAIMIAKDTALFPPNTLFRLKEVKQPGEWEAPRVQEGYHPGTACFKSHQSPIVGYRYVHKSGAQSQRGSGRRSVAEMADTHAALRFAVGDQVCCNMGSWSDATWQNGTVTALNPRKAPANQAYQVHLDDGSEVTASKDDDGCIKAAGTTVAHAWSNSVCAAEYEKLPAEEQAEYISIEPTHFNPRVFPNQRLLVCTATYQEPAAATADAGSGGKMCVSNVSLQYGSRAAYIKGLDDLIAKPVLTMAMEFGRELQWTDWLGVKYTLREEWACTERRDRTDDVIGTAKSTEKCTPGTRDANNDGKTPADFLASANGFILSRRAKGHGTRLPHEAAFLTLEEVLSIRLYSGPAYQPINVFLRQISNLSGEYRKEVAHHSGLTFAATVGHICRAIRKLAAVATPEEATAPLWRGVRGVLPKTFWVPDEGGMVCAVDMGFMSTSRNRQTPIQYMAGSEMENVLWCLKPGPESDSAYHRGADISRLSQFAGEEEVLFPPCTMLEVRKASPTELEGTQVPKTMSTFKDVLRGGESEAERMSRYRVQGDCDENGKKFISIDVLPHFL